MCFVKELYIGRIMVLESEPVGPWYILRFSNRIPDTEFYPHPFLQM